MKPPSLRTLLGWPSGGTGGGDLGNLRFIGCAAAVVASLAAGAALYGMAGGRTAPERPGAEAEAASLRRQVAELRREPGVTRLASGALPGELQIELTTLDELKRQVESLEAENARLKEDLALFESLAAADTAVPGVTLSGLRVEPDSLPGRYRYRFLVTFRGVRTEKEFRGAYQLLVGLQAGEGKGAMIVPASGDADRARFDLRFRFFRRVEGSFAVPDGARPVSVEVRLTQDGVLRASQTAVL